MTAMLVGSTALLGSDFYEDQRDTEPLAWILFESSWFGFSSFVLRRQAGNSKPCEAQYLLFINARLRPASVLIKFGSTRFAPSGSRRSRSNLSASQHVPIVGSV